VDSKAHKAYLESCGCDSVESFKLPEDPDPDCADAARWSIIGTGVVEGASSVLDVREGPAAAVLVLAD
jgi:hypothetical protein